METGQVTDIDKYDNDSHYLTIEGIPGTFLCKVIGDYGDLFKRVEVSPDTKYKIITSGLAEFDEDACFTPTESNTFIALPTEIRKPSDLERLMRLAESDQ